ncbi:ASCH domain-containing protein [Pseudoxanthobacter sp. M-2]|uniref:ASCH domain-containing protein n=1 Tax=Pseudoxanthobacter sp. M-2 TaxID=3078754 RepID=UPI0038FC8655
MIIDEPWMGLILRGEKTWEMRRTGCQIRGRIALIRKGSGQVVGTADVLGSLPEIASAEEYGLAEDKHRIPPERQDRAFSDGWRTPWVLERALPLSQPVAYDHPSGAVIWVQLDPRVSAAVEAQVGGLDEASGLDRPLAARLPRAAADLPSRVPPNSTTSVNPPAGSPASGVPAPPSERRHETDAGMARVIRITGGNVRNHHIYLPLDFFPEDAVGGSNKADRAPRTLTISFSPGRTVTTDIDRTKRILRERSAVADFLTRAEIMEGDEVIVERVELYRYQISKAVHD